MEIGISDARNIMEFLTDLKGFDFSNHSVILVKRRIESFMAHYSIRSISHLLEKLTDDLMLLDKFVQFLLCESSEMFRDPSFWILLRDSVLPKIFERNPTPVFWVPACVSGDELYSLCYLLLPYQSAYSYKIEAGCFTQLGITQIQNGFFVPSKMEMSAENSKGVLDFELNFSKNENGDIQRDINVLSDVNFTKSRLSGFDKPNFIPDFILCRNRLLNYNLTIQQRIVQTFYESLALGGYFAVGIKEHAEAGSSPRLFKAVSEFECIFQKNN